MRGTKIMNKFKVVLDEYEMYDLSFPLSHDVVSWPTHQPIMVKKVKRVDRDLYEMHEISMTTQDYTHYDAPSHMIADGKSIDKYEINRFILDAVILNLQNRNGFPISQEDLKKFQKYLNSYSGIILYTGFNKDLHKYEYDWSYLDVSGAEYLSRFNNVRLVA
ncbi:cyclase, partial [Sulfolobus sp. E5]